MRLSKKMPSYDLAWLAANKTTDAERALISGREHCDGVRGFTCGADYYQSAIENLKAALALAEAAHLKATEEYNAKKVAQEKKG